MKQNYTHILYLLDRSGSMATVAAAVKEGFDGFIAEQKALPGDCTFSLIQFDDRYEVNHNFANIQSIPPLEFVPRGSTALYDAAVRAVDELGKQLDAMPEFARPEKVLVIIHTDGQENSSRNYNRQSIAERIRHQEDKYFWKFIFLGTNFDVWGEATGLGINHANTMSYRNDHKGISHAYCCTSRGVSNLRSATMDSYIISNCFDGNNNNSEDTNLAVDTQTVASPT